MAFNSILFLIFFPLVAFGYFLIPHRFRWILLLLASYYFYMCWRPEYLLLILASTLVDYFAGLAMGRCAEKSLKRKYLFLSLFLNLGLLFSFKYFNFFNASLRDFSEIFHLSWKIRDLDVLLPVGISFYTFQTLSYSIDVYRGHKKPEKHLGIFALYVAFFPQLVAGPIERSQNLLPQFFERHHADIERITSGLRLMLWGLFKKVVIADRLSLLVDAVYTEPHKFSGPSFIIATVFFAFQIYCDFSGYSDIAIGAAEVMGFRLMKNFNRPYLSRSIREFWSRWHMSLSTWFRDYVYIPLGGKHVSTPRWVINIFVTFLLSGIWHGANWTFFIWGSLHGFYYLFSAATAKLRQWLNEKIGLATHPAIHQLVQIFITFGLVCFSWIFFRANTLRDAFYIIGHLPAGWGEPLRFKVGEVVGLGLTRADFILAVGLIVLLIIVQIFEQFGSVRERFSGLAIWLRWPVYVTLALMIMNFGITETVPFIYFQF